MNRIFRQHFILLLLVWWPLQTLAAGDLESWRIAVTQVRGLAENDIPQAATKAQRLAESMPPEATPEDKVRLLNVQARIALYQGDSAQTAQYAEQALALARDIDDRVGQAEADLCIVLNAVNQSRFDRMKEATEDSMVVLQGVDRPDLLAEAMLRTSMMYLRYGQTDKALLTALQNLETARQSDQPLAMAYAHQGMAIVFDQNGSKAAARDHYREMLHYAQDAHSGLLEADAQISLGTILVDLGSVESGERLVHEAIDKKYRKAGGPFYLAHALFVLADFQRKRQHYREALKTLEESIDIYTQRNNKVGLWWSLQAQSSIWLMRQNLDRSQQAAERAYKLAREIGMPLYLGESTRRLAELSARRGDYQVAYRYASEADELFAKSRNEVTANRIMELARQYESESKQRRIQELTRDAEQQAAQQRLLWTVLAATAALLALTVAFLLRLRRSRAEIRKLNAGLEERVQARAEELQESRASLAEAQRIAHIGSWQMDLVDNVLTWSDEIYQIFESERGEFGASYEAFMEAVHPDDRKLVDLTYREALEKHLPFEIEHRLLLPDGRIKYVHERCETTYDDNGKPLCSIGTVQDITVRKEMENSLRESRQLMAESQRIAQVGSWEYDIASDTHTWSDELFRIYEINPAEGASYAGCMNATHPDDREAVANAYLSAVESGQPYESEHRLLMKDGRIKYVHERGETLCGPDGRLLRAVGMMQDITERKQVEKKLKEALEFTEGIINAIPDVLLEMDSAGRYLNVWTQNPALLAAQRETLLGKTVHQVLSPENAAAAMAAIREADAKGYAQGKDILVDVSGGQRWFAHTLSRKPGGEPGAATYLALSRDITERKLLEQTLAERERELRALAESSPGMMGSFHLKPDGTVCMPYVSPNILELFGVRPEQLIEDAGPLLRLTHPDDASKVMDSIAESARTMNQWHCEYRILHPLKGLRWMEGRTNPQPHPAGGTIWYGYVHDITERKRMEAALQDSEARYRNNYHLLQSIIESPSASVSIYAFDHEYRLLAFNSRFKAAAKRLWGADIQLGMSILDAIDTEAHRIVFKQGALAVLAGKHGFLESQEERLENGKLVREYHDNYGAPIFDDHGKVVGMTVFVLNTTERKEAELKLKEALEFSEGVINAIPDILFELDREGRYLNVWTQNPELLAAQKEVLLGRRFSEVLSPEAAAASMEALREADEKGYVQGKDISIDLPQGKRWFSHTISKKVGGVSGKVTFLALSRDITERKQLEQALAESEARYRYHFNQLQSMLQSASSVSVFALDREYRYLFFNKRHREGVKRLRGTDIEIGMNMVETIPDAEFREFCRRGFDRVLAGNVVSVESKEKVVKDGITTYEYNDNYGSPIFNDRGEVIGLTVFAINTTERKRLEAELHASHAFLNSVIDAVPDPIFVKDREHRWILLNEAFCRFTGLARDVLSGKSDYDVFPKAEADVFWEKDELVFNSGDVNLNEEDFTSVDGVRHFIQTKKTPFHSADGSQMLVGVIRDITDRMQYETAREAALAEAVKLAKMRSDFLSRMSHELRTPLNGILGYTQVLQRARKLTGKDADALEVIRHSGEYLLSLIDDILDLARIDAGRFQLDIADIALPTFLRAVCDMVRIRAREKGVDFRCDLPDDLPSGVRGDERRLRQVLLNLLANAIKFTAQGWVALQIERRQPGRFAFVVSDTGIGIPADELERIFLPFEQVDSRSRAEGNGLGLSICRELLRMMGGDITVHSREGEGSTFTFELALPEIDLQAQAQLRPPEPASQLPSATPAQLVPPPHTILLELLELAKLGSMRDILLFAERIERQTPALHPFALHLRELAEAYQSKRILSMVEDYLNDTATR